MALLDKIHHPADLKKLSLEELSKLAEEIRARIIEVVYKNGGHLSSNLGVVELTIALHYVFDLAFDRLIWDVSHQCYTHKLLTGRQKKFDTLRLFGGLSGFSCHLESPYDPFTIGHAGTSVSLALGVACANSYLKHNRKAIAVLGDGALGCGMTFEALNHAGMLKKDLLVILNDNKMSISYTVGALANYLNKLRMSPLYKELKEEVYKILEKIPKIGPLMEKAVDYLRTSALVPLGGAIFEEMGFAYYGPIDGHHIPTLINVFREAKQYNKPVLLHIITEKGKGLKEAEENPSRFHGIGPVAITQNGKLSYISDKPTYTDVFGRVLARLAQEDKSIIAITAAMPEGTGLVEFAQKFPQQYYDVGICEQHAVGLAAGLASQGLKPVVAIYSTFLQRAFDQLFQEIALQATPLDAARFTVIFALDRAGLVGSDGPTHHGVFDIAYTRLLPGFILMAPKDGTELEMMLEYSLTLSRPVIIRYPRCSLPEDTLPSKPIELGKAEILKFGKDGVILAYGSMVYEALQAAKILEQEGIDIMVVNARFAKPLDEQLITTLIDEQPLLVTVEEHSLVGGFGSAVLECLVRLGKNIQRVITIGIPDMFITHGPRQKLLEIVGLTGEKIAQRIRSELVNHAIS